jgi:hypothetical protein
VYRSILRKLKSYESDSIVSFENPDGLSEADADTIASACQSKGYGSLSSVLLLLLLIISIKINELIYLRCCLSRDRINKTVFF